VPPPSLPSAHTRLLRLGVAIVIAALAATSYMFWPRSDSFPFYFEIAMRSARSGFAQLYYDTGAGLNERDSSRLPLEGGNKQVTYRFPLPEGTYTNLRFDPTDRARNAMTLSGARIVDRGGNLFRVIPPTAIKAVHDIEELTAGNTQVTFTTAATATDPILSVDPGEPLILKNFTRPSIRTLTRRFLISFLVAAGIGLSASHLLVSRIAPKARGWLINATSWRGAHPRQLLLAASAASVILSCYPIVFFGKSFVSPNNHSHTFLLYGEMPTVPGYNEVVTDDEKGSDLGATMWYSWPTSVVESRALLKDFELPLWNRYDSAGLPLLGQGQSMFGDPLHSLVLLTNGAAGWWDLKYLLAKFLFAAALGLCVLQLTKHRPAAVIVSLTAPFIGFFSYRYSHPAFFSMCYAPLILFSWFTLIDAPKGRRTSVCLGLMVLANWTVMNSGTVKEAYVLLLAMNFCGCLTLLASPAKNKITKFGLGLAAQVLFVVIATPVWLTFLNTLRSSWTVYGAGGAFQLQPSLLIGLFDDIFYRQFNAGELHLDPSANFLVLGAVLWFCLSPHRGEAGSLCWGPAVTCLLALVVVFGIVPPALIVRLPFIGQIYHVDNTFSDVAIICLLVLAGFGMRAFWSDCRTITFGNTVRRVALVGGCLLLLYLGTTEAAQRSSRTLLQISDHIPKSPFFWGYALSLVVGLVAAVWISREIIAARRLLFWQAVVLAFAVVLLHWRHGMHLKTPFDAYVMNPQQRTNLIAESSGALQLIASASKEPSRSVGLDYDLTPGYGGAIGIEEIDGLDPLLNRHYRSLLDAFGAKLPFGSSNAGVIDGQLENDLPLFDMLNVRYYLGHPGSRADVIPSLSKIAALDLNVYESSRVWPRAFFTDRYVTSTDVTSVVQLLKTGDGTPFAAIPNDELDKQPELKTLAHGSSAAMDTTIVPAADFSLTSNTTSFKVNAPSSGVVVLTEPYIADDFQLRINNRPASYFLVNGAFKGIFLPQAGSYSISYRYWPRSFTMSLWLAGAGLIALSLWLVLAARGTSSQS
jgi:hypothetical protein